MNPTLKLILGWLLLIAMSPVVVVVMALLVAGLGYTLQMLRTGAILAMLRDAFS